jgi:hypothetical protein
MKELRHVPAFQKPVHRNEPCGRAGQALRFGTWFSFFRTVSCGGADGEETSYVGRVVETASIEEMMRVEFYTESVEGLGNVGAFRSLHVNEKPHRDGWGSSCLGTVLDQRLA